jgi:hypothetical protein
MVRKGRERLGEGVGGVGRGDRGGDEREERTKVSAVGERDSRRDGKGMHKDGSRARRGI